MSDNAPNRPFGVTDLLLVIVAVTFGLAPFLIVEDGGISARFSVLTAIVVPPAALLALSQRRFGGRADPLPQLDQASAYLER